MSLCLSVVCMCQFIYFVSHLHASFSPLAAPQAFTDALSLTRKLVSSMGVGKVAGPRRGPYLSFLKEGFDFAMENAPEQVPCMCMLLHFAYYCHMHV